MCREAVLVGAQPWCMPQKDRQSRGAENLSIVCHRHSDSPAFCVSSPTLLPALLNIPLALSWLPSPACLFDYVSIVIWVANCSISRTIRALRLAAGVTQMYSRKPTNIPNIPPWEDRKPLFTMQLVI